MSDGDQDDRALRLRYELDAPPAKVWLALTRPELLARWLVPPGAGEPNRLSVLDCVPDHLIRYGWREADDGDATSVVSFRIAPNPEGGTSFEIVHERLSEPKAANSNLRLQSRAA